MSHSIEVVIPVHDPARPLERGIRSVLAQRGELSAHGVTVSVTVVCHNIGVEKIQASLPAALAKDDDVTWLGHADGTRSPAGPRNAALDRSEATFLSFLDSDDYLEPGSLAAWWTMAVSQGAAAVIAPLRTPEGIILPAPRIRPSKPEVLHALRDGLAYRSVPYGLLRRDSLESIGFRYAEGITTGEDIEATLKLWFRGGAIAYPYGAPAYHQTDDSGAGRVTSSILPLGQEFQWLEQLFTTPWLLEASLPERRSMAQKILRVHGIGALLRRASAGTADSSVSLWNESERHSWVSLYDGLQSLAGGSLPALNRRDAALARAATAASTLQDLRAAVDHYTRAGKIGELVAVNPLHTLARDSVLRHYVNEKLRARAGVFAAPAAAPVA